MSPLRLPVPPLRHGAIIGKIVGSEKWKWERKRERSSKVLKFRSAEVQK